MGYRNNIKYKTYTFFYVRNGIHLIVGTASLYLKDVYPQTYTENIQFLRIFKR